jgi:hypothetical protein
MPRWGFEIREVFMPTRLSAMHLRAAYEVVSPESERTVVGGQEAQSRSHGEADPWDPRAQRLSRAVRFVTTCRPN